MLASTASENLVNTESERQNVLLSLLNVQQTVTEETRIGRLLIKLLRMEHEMLGTSTERPVSEKLIIDIDVDSDTAAESDFSVKSRFFLNRVNGRLRKMLNRSPEDSMQDIDKRL